MTERGGTAGTQQPDWICERCWRLLPEGAWDTSPSGEWLCRSCSEAATKHNQPAPDEQTQHPPGRPLGWMRWQ
jgi:hypothetical protein